MIKFGALNEIWSKIKKTLNTNFIVYLFMKKYT